MILESSGDLGSGDSMFTDDEDSFALNDEAEMENEDDEDDDDDNDEYLS